MRWIVENWLLALLVGGALVLHFLLHGHGRHKGGSELEKQRKPDAEKE